MSRHRQQPLDRRVRPLAADAAHPRSQTAGWAALAITLGQLLATLPAPRPGASASPSTPWSTRPGSSPTPRTSRAIRQPSASR
jgi:hypothetical protein